MSALPDYIDTMQQTLSKSVATQMLKLTPAGAKAIAALIQQRQLELAMEAVVVGNDPVFHIQQNAKHQILDELRTELVSIYQEKTQGDK